MIIRNRVWLYVDRTDSELPVEIKYWDNEGNVTTYLVMIAHIINMPVGLMKPTKSQDEPKVVLEYEDAKVDYRKGSKIIFIIPRNR